MTKEQAIDILNTILFSTIPVDLFDEIACRLTVKIKKETTREEVLEAIVMACRAMEDQEEQYNEAYRKGYNLGRCMIHKRSYEIGYKRGYEKAKEVYYEEDPEE